MKTSRILPTIPVIVLCASMGFQLARAQSPVPRFAGPDRAGTKRTVPQALPAQGYPGTVGHKLNEFQIDALRRYLAGAATVGDTLNLIAIQVQFSDSLMGGQEGSQREGQPRDSTYFANTLKHTNQYFDGA
ncbi:MAG: hypothetical protein P8181_12440, partial [bacterium]